MWLLNTRTLELEDFESNAPEYAILSHTWGEGEITFQTLTRKAQPELKGWKKINNCCKRAAQDGWRYIWIDTCCIDKSSSVELSEAINSMFRSYFDAAVCYAYLVDVGPGSWDEVVRRFKESRWFTRGWTLQELLAPAFLIFLDCTWTDIGSRNEWAEVIAEVTHIRVAYQTDFMACSAATKFSWASHRETKRVEDQAYCLLGLFDLNMPLLYGEGSAAFKRLQLELIWTTDDESVFAWFGQHSFPFSVRRVPFSMLDRLPEQLLAPSPAAFAESNYVVRCTHDGDRQQRQSFAVTNKGLVIQVQLYIPKDGFYGPLIRSATLCPNDSI